jgi:hypothetical protein
MMRRDVWPLAINLPGGKRAEHVPGSRPPRYAVDGVEVELDVEIPDDLLANGWYWSGSFLYHPWPGSENGSPGVAISTGTFPPPGWPQEPIRVKGTDDQGQPIIIEEPARTCFDSARILNSTREEVAAWHAAELAKRAKKTSGKKRKKAEKPAAAPPPPPPAPVVEEVGQVRLEQLELELT